MNIRLGAPVEKKKDFNVISINGMSFVAGLDWQNLSSPVHYMDEARRIGKEKGMSIVAIRQGMVIQAGYVPKTNEVAQRGMYSLSLAVAAALPEDAKDNFAGAFRLDDGRFAVIAVSEGAVVPIGDIIEGSAEAAEGRLQLIQNFFSDDKNNCPLTFYAPEELGFPAEGYFELKDLLIPGRIAKDARLKKLFFGMSNRELLIYSSIVLISLFLTWHYYSKWQFEKEVAAEKERQAALRAEKLKKELDQKRITSDAMKKPWVERESFRDGLSRCVAVIYKAPLSIAGWRWVGGKCTIKNAEWEYSRLSGATINDLNLSASKDYGIYPVIQSPGDKSKFIFELKPLSSRGDDVTQKIELTMDNFVSYFQKLNVEAMVSEEQPNPSLNVNGTAVKLSWVHFSFEVKTQYEPEFLMSMLPQSGIRFTELMADGHSEGVINWTIKGEIYALR